MNGRILNAYDERLQEGELEEDPAQRALVQQLDALAGRLESYDEPRNWWSRLIDGARTVPLGLYMYGGVGRGKTMLMDLFFETVQLESKLRVHFHEFMSDVHDRIKAARQSYPGDPIPFVASELAENAKLLCFDEFHVTDIADAMILGRLFRGLFDNGVVVVATSNAHPTKLYRNGLNRQLFLPFIDLLQRKLQVVELKSAKDFRLDKLSGVPLYFVPVNEESTEALEGHWQRLTGGHPAKAIDLDVKGRKLHVPACSMGVARFSFDELCNKPLGASDYLHIAHAFHTIMLDGIPRLTRDRRDVARRFITLIDALYDSRICLIASADAEPDALYPEGDGADLFERTASRLYEMRSEAYLAGRSGSRLANEAAV